MPSTEPFQLLFGPLMPKMYQPFDRVIEADWHIVSGESGQPTSQNKNIQTIRFEFSDASHTITQDVLPFCPPGWRPDLLLYAMPDYYLAAVDLPQLDFPVAVLIGDWYMSFDRLLSLRSAFDFWIMDATAVPLFQQAGIQNLMSFPVFSLNLKKYQTVAVERPIYDLGFAGNLRTDVHTRRAHYLYRLSLLAKQYKVRLATDLFKDDYIRFCKQCKIIFNYSIHGELNMRCFEALGCQTLMLLEATNQETPAYLTPGQHYVQYTFSELEQVIAYYLTHEQERLQIAQAGFEAIQQYGAQQTWLDLKQRLQVLLEKGVIRRQSRSPIELDSTINLVFNVNPPFNNLQVAGETLIKRLREAPEALDANNLGVIYYAMWLYQGAREDSSSLQSALYYFQQALRLEPDYPLAAYNMAQLYLLLEAYDLAEAWLKTCLQNLNGKEWPWGLVAYPYIERSYEKFYQPWFMASVQLEYVYLEQPHTLFVERKRLLEAHIYFYLGQVALQALDLDLAVTYWQSALKKGRHRLRQLVPEIMDLQRRLNQPLAALKLWAEGLGDPINPALWIIHLQSLYLAQQDFLYGCWYPIYQRLLQTVPGSDSWQESFDALPIAEISPRDFLRHYGLNANEQDMALERLITTWCGISWQDLIEPEPPFYGYLGISEIADCFHYGLNVSNQMLPEGLQRVYDQPTNLAAGLLAPDFLPCSFPDLQTEISDLPEQAWLVILPAYTDLDLIQALLQAVTQQAGPEQALVLWHPFRTPEAEDWDGFIHILSYFEAYNLTFYERLTLNEQAYLMNHIQQVLAYFQADEAYYLWWALSLKQKFWIYPSVERFPLAWQACLNSNQGLEHFWSQDPELRKKAAIYLRYFMLDQQRVGRLWTHSQPHLHYLF